MILDYNKISDPTKSEGNPHLQGWYREGGSHPVIKIYRNFFNMSPQFKCLGFSTSFSKIKKINYGFVF